MKYLITAFALMCGAASAVQAATYQAVFSNIHQSNNALSIIGADPSAPSMTFTWEVDETAATLAGPFSYNYYYGFVYSYLRYKSFSVNVGGVRLDGDLSNNVHDRIYVRDGRWNGRYRITDYFQVLSSTAQALSNEWRLDHLYFYVGDRDLSVLTDVEHPTVTELSRLDEYGYARIGLRNTRNGASANVYASGTPEITEIPESPEISVMPLPAGAPLLFAGLAALAVLRRRQRG